jgi:hypothetical protein
MAFSSVKEEVSTLTEFEPYLQSSAGALAKIIKPISRTIPIKL